MAITIFLVASAGALGAITRYFIVALADWLHLAPWGTFTVNVAGCFAIGVVIAHFDSVAWFQEYGRSLLVVGFLGAFTTFSAFSADFLELMHAGRFQIAALYVVLTVFSCLIATFFGFKIATQ